MTLTTSQFAGIVGAWLWPFIRVGAFLLAAPVFGNRAVPSRVRMGLTIGVTLVVVPVLPTMPALDPFSSQGLLTAVQQVVIGLALGFSLRLVYAVLEVGGQLIAHLSGLGFAALVDPQNGIDVPVVSQLYIVVATLVFLGLDGHLVVIRVLADSFLNLPVGPMGISRMGLWHLSEQAGWFLSAAVLLAVPAVAALLTVNLAFGVMTRAAPQLNIFAVGFPVTLLFGLAIMWLTLPGAIAQFEELFDDGVAFARAVLARN
jgi:flagellar biosynthetic protein FliR